MKKYTHVHTSVKPPRGPDGATYRTYLVANQSAHARGLAACLGSTHMQVRAVLQGIEQAGIAVSRSEGRTWQYAIDQAEPMSLPFLVRSTC